MANSCALARQRLARFVADLRTAKGIEKTVQGVKATYVVGIKTPARAFTGNFGFAGVVRPLIQAGEGSIDAALSVARSIASGGKVKPHELREVASAFDADGLRAMFRGEWTDATGATRGGFKGGTQPVREAAAAARGLAPGTAFGERIHTFVRELGDRLEASGQQHAVEHERVTYRSRLAQTAVDGAFAVLEAADRPFWKMSYEASLYAQAKLNAIREGLTGDARKAAAARYFEAPTAEMVVRATDDANYATFKDRNVLSTLATGAKRGLARLATQDIDPADPRADAKRRGRTIAKATQVATEQIMPFTGVPSSIAAKSASMSPLGIIQLLADKSQAQRARTLATYSAGAAFMYLGAQLFKSGRLTLGTPKDAGERALDDAEGRLPYAVKVGNRWVSLMVLGPPAVSLAIGGRLAQLGEEKPDASAADRALVATASSVKTLTEQTYLDGVRRVLDVRENEQAIPRLAAGFVPVPAAAGQFARAIDSNVRRPDGITETLAGKVPGGTYASRERLDPFGRPVRRDALERVGEFVSPFPSRAAQDDRVAAELRRLKAFPSVPPTRVSIMGRVKEMTPAERDAFVRATGPVMHAQLEGLLDDPRFRTLPDERKRLVLKQTIEHVRDVARRFYFDGDADFSRFRQTYGAGASAALPTPE